MTLNDCFSCILYLGRSDVRSFFVNVTGLTDIDDFAVRTVNSCQATASPPSSTTADPGSTCSTAPSSPYSRWELSTVPPRPTIYSNRVGMDPDLPLTRLRVHNPQTVFSLFPFFTQRLDSLRYIARLHIHRILNRITFHTAPTVSVTDIEQNVSFSHTKFECEMAPNQRSE